VALLQGWALALVGIPGTALVSNPLTGLLAAVSLFVYLGLYTPLKARSVTAVYVGAVPGALPIAMGWTAVTGRLDAGALALFSLLFVWQIPHFIAISLYRREEYAAAGFKILPLVYGERASLWHMLGTSLGLALATLAPALMGLGGTLYTVTAGIMGTGILVAALRGLLPHPPEAWARRFFLATLIYLPVVLGVLVADGV
jgi:protoheme IX farnesyltransferase